MHRIVVNNQDISVLTHIKNYFCYSQAYFCFHNTYVGVITLHNMSLFTKQSMNSLTENTTAQVNEVHTLW